MAGLDSGSWKDPKWAGEPIPLLVPVVATVPDGKRLFVEVKCGPEIVPFLVEHVAAAGKKPEPIAFMSFGADVCAAVKKALPAHQIYYLSGFKTGDDGVVRPSFDEFFAKAHELGVDGIDVSFKGPRGAEAVRRIHEAGLYLAVYTLDDPALGAQLAGMGVDSITTNTPGVMRAYFEASRQLSPQAQKNFSQRRAGFFINRRQSNLCGGTFTADNKKSACRESPCDGGPARRTGAVLNQYRQGEVMRIWRAGVVAALAVVGLFASGAGAQTIIVDNDGGAPGYLETGGPWTTSSSSGYQGSTYRFVLDSSPLSTATWTPTITVPGVYSVSLGLRTSTNRPTNTPITINHAGGTTTASVSTFGPNTVTEVPVGSFLFNAGTGGWVRLTNNGSAGAYIADAVIFRRTTDQPPAITNWRTVPAPPTAGQAFDLVADVVDDGGVASVRVDYQFAGESPVMGASASPLLGAGANAWGVSLPGRPPGTVLTYAFHAMDTIGQTSTTGLQSLTIGPPLPTEWRSIWADSWNASFLSPAQADDLLNRVRANNLNTVMIEIRKIGDAYYNSNLEPRATNISGGAGYDPLGYVLQQAHDTTAGRKRIEVHGWFVMQRISKGETLSPQHVLSRHPEYIMTDSAGNTVGGGSIFLDPGHPGAVDHNIAVILDCLANYPTMDGVNLDYIRYPEASGSWGYNPVSVARFNKVHNRTGQPAGSDPLWASWRRECVTLQVRKLHVKMRKHHPSVVLTACTINWGTGYSNFTTSSAYAQVFQDWVGWLQAGIIDYNALMNYATSTSRYQGWTNLSLASDDSRGSIIGVGAYLQPTVQASMDQILWARGQGANGFNIYDWGSEVQGTGGSATRDQFYAALKAQVTPTWADPPRSPWIDSPTTGIIEGDVFLGTTPIDHATVWVVGQAGSQTVSDGSGWFGVLDVAPGTRTVTVSAPGLGSRNVVVNDLAAGEVRTISVNFGVPAAMMVY